jgi:O-6-methylguanine DNA methyltransferase
MRGNVPGNIFKTPLGWAGVAASEQGVSRIVLPKKDKRAVEQELRSSEFIVRGSEMSGPSDSRILAKAVDLLAKYFSGESVSFDLPLDLRYYTPFQQAVWRAAAEIPPGETRSYAWIAKRIKNPLAVRAVGQALGANPIPIIIPCHRVISSSGAMGGYSGGIGMKEKLLALEAAKNKYFTAKSQSPRRKA